MFRTAFLDLLLNTALLFVCLFAMAFVHMRQPTDGGKAVDAKAEYIVEMTWPEGSIDDIDLWLLLPDGRRVGFTGKDAGLATLDRDDRGAFGDVFYDGEERKLIRSNREVMAVRGLAPGRYVVNVHYYGDFTEDMLGFPDEWRRPDIPVKVKLTRLNPRVAEIGTNEVTLFAAGQQATAFAFEVDAEGAPTLHKDADLPFVEMRK
jgi:hypothetical protein